MRRLGVGLLSIVVVVGLAVAACSGSPAATANPGGSAGGGGGAANAGANPGSNAGGGGGGGAAAGDISKVDACSLLKPAEIEQALGVTGVSQGVNQDSDQVKQCEWDTPNSLVTVGVTVRPFTDSDWQTLQAFPKAVAVSGLGDAALRNSPLTGDLAVKHNGYEVEMGVANFSKLTQAQVDQAADSMMKLMLSRT